MNTKLEPSEILQAKITALHTAQRLHPDQKVKINKQMENWSGVDLGTYQDVAAKPTEIIKTADIIFEWLIK